MAQERPASRTARHRANKLVWENTLSAFARAVEAGFAIECDLHYASDGVPVVFHDGDLEHLCNLKGDVRERRIAGTWIAFRRRNSRQIPTLRQLLELVKGRVPLVIELKGRETDDEGFVEAVLEELEGYEARWR